MNKGRRAMLGLIEKSGFTNKYVVGMYLEEEGSEETCSIVGATESREDVMEMFREFERMYDQEGMVLTYQKGGDRMSGRTPQGLTLCVEAFTKRGGKWC